MKLGLDFHGVVEAYPKFFQPITKTLINAGHQVHIITGAKYSEEIYYKLNYECGLLKGYTHFFSIVDHHTKQGTNIWYDEKETPWMDEGTWNKTKSYYCERENINLHIDDSMKYLEHFTTPFVHFVPGGSFFKDLTEKIEKTFNTRIQGS